MTFQPASFARDRERTAPRPDDGPLLSILVPVKDEEAAIRPFLDRVVPILETICGAQSWEILFVDDGSEDRTYAAILAAHLADARVAGLSLSRNFGKEAALSAGLDHVRGQATVPMDVDMQDPPEVLADMVAKWREGYDTVVGVRRDRASDSLVKRWTATLYYRTYNMLSDDRIPEHAGDFRLLDRRVVEVIRRLPERNRFMKGLFAWAGFRQAAVEYVRSERAVGKTKFRYLKLWRLGLDGITSSSTAPLRMSSYVGLTIAVFAIAYALFIVSRTMLLGIAVPGYASLIVSVLFLGGVQLISLGVLGEYVGRILIEAKGRPLFVIKDSIGLADETSREP
jgi:glycosyltransferase involved in cell wall biosynthesis